MPKYAKVLIDQSAGKPFDYEIPEALGPKVHVGSRVSVPVRTRLVLATVIELSDTTEAEGVRAVERVVGERPVLSPTLLRLANWISEYYCCPVEATLRSVLPQVIRKAEITHKKMLFARLLRPLPDDELSALEKKAPTQAAALEFLKTTGAPVAVSELLKRCGASHQAVQALAKKGLVAVEDETVMRDPHRNEIFLHAPKLELNAEQAAVFGEIQRAIEPSAGAGETSAFQLPLPFLLHGVTGSGKTEIYLQAIERVLEQGRTAIMLVPEISLTPQTVERFKSRFAAFQEGVAVLHSHLSQGERHDEWHKINDGRARIVIGARSAIFAPLENLGLIVVDEEHENSYKQEEAPRYNARDVAVVRARMENCAIILGSATPSIESFQNATKGKYRLLRLTQRVDNQKMPFIRIIDMRQESLRQKGQAVLSEKLCAAITARLAKREQTILFLNRRGFSTSLICGQCGYVCQCPNCSIALTFHRAASRVVCHICGHTAVAPGKCPDCGDPKIKYSGTGTEKVEETVTRFFPKAVVRRMDADVMTRKESYRETLGAFRSGKIDILVGTQMIAKGLHFPNVTLVGIINADLALHIPDFRAGERTFQLLTQVAGRAGRGEVEGEVFVQSFTPFHPAIQFARHHDFDGFWQQEIEFREKWEYPPFTHMVLITLRSPHQARAVFSAETLERRLRESLPPGTTLSSPAPAPLEKSHGNFRYQLMLRSRSILKLSRTLRGILEKLTFPEEVIVTVDVDPYQLM
jgi:primosomal protein N' (replication factor Y)